MKSEHIGFLRQMVVVTVMLLLPFSVLAKRISESEALHRAQVFLNLKRTKHIQPANIKMALKGRKARATTADASYYVFNVGQNEGFVIVSGDDRTSEILGYADSGSIDNSNIPSALQYFLEGYAEQIEWLDASPEHSNLQKTQYKAPARSQIDAMIETQWNQGAPYNGLCPVRNNNRTVTGCVATSMAQVMYYWKYPTNECTAIPGYTTQNGYFTLSGLPAATFDWNVMKHTYSSDETGTAADAVAKLMYYCGVSLHMNYNTSSAAYSSTIPDALKLYFGYDGTINFAERRHYSYQDWVSLIYNELASGRPVILGGQSAGGGHSFVCDGYDIDDYFHINWGWGGQSDGYFRLSALNPEEQGIGGSSTLDGFSYSQDAVIGISRFNGNVGQKCLTLEAFYLNYSGNYAEKTITRANSSDVFSGINLYVRTCSYLFGTNAFDYAVQLTDAEETVIETLYEEDNHSFVFNTDAVKSLSNLSTANALTDGTYYIRVVCRETGLSEWQNCYDMKALMITAEVSGNTMTLSAPVVMEKNPTLNAITVEGNKTVGYEQTVIATVKGGAADYHENILLKINGKVTMGKQVDIPAGQTVDVRFVYTPTTAGTNTIAIVANSSQIGTETIEIAESDVTDNIELNFSATIDNETADGKLYGNALRATITVTNPSTENVYSGTVNCSLRKWTYTDNGDNTTTWSWLPMGVTYHKVTIDKQGQAVINLARNDLEKGAYYSVRVTYRRTNGNSTLGEGLHIGLGSQGVGTLEVADGYLLGDAAGNAVVYPSSTIIDGADACFVDLRPMSSTENITVVPSSNPNCLYLLNADATVPEALQNYNVVLGNEAENIELSDGYNFCSPIDFKANNISYTRTFTLAADGTAGWNTIMLPFAVSNIECNGNTIDWFHSTDDVYKNFWLREFVSDDLGNADFDYTESMAAYTPYIIAVPDNRFGDVWQLTGNSIVFRGTEADIQTTTASGEIRTFAVSGNYYRFSGTTTATAISDVYALNATGSKFVKVSSATAPAFRAWLSAISISSLSLPSLSIGSGETTGIMLLPINDASPSIDEWYTISGVRLNSKPSLKGIYILNGKKVIIN